VRDRRRRHRLFFDSIEAGSEAEPGVNSDDLEVAGRAIEGFMQASHSK